MRGGSKTMLSIPGNARLFICQHPVNMCKSFEGLSAIVEKFFPNELLSRALFIFLNRRKDHMKADETPVKLWQAIKCK